MATKNLKIGSLLLDQSNPRIPPVHRQREALQQVVDDQEESLPTSPRASSRRD
jgi:hypothetical protein